MTKLPVMHQRINRNVAGHTRTKKKSVFSPQKYLFEQFDILMGDT